MHPLLQNRGGVLLEGCFAIGLLIFSALLILEVTRRAQFEVALQHLACMRVRGQALGAPAEWIERKSSDFLKTALGSLAEKVRYDRYELRDSRELGLLHLGHKPGGVIEVSLNYPQFTRFLRGLQGDSVKHEQELLERCLFPF